MKGKIYNYWATNTRFYSWKRISLDKLIGSKITETEFWLALNGNLNLIKYDPLFAEFRESEQLNFGDYRLYEIVNASFIRSDSVRFLGHLKTDEPDLLKLDLSNGPVYQMWENITKANPECDIITDNWDREKPNQIHVWDYVKFFFNNVAGRHGRFEIVETVEDIKNRVNTLYKLDPTLSNELASKEKQNDWDIALKEACELYNHNGNEYITKTEKEYVVTNALMTFKNSLFRASVHISIDKKSGENEDLNEYGFMSLSDETLGVLSYNENNQPYIKFGDNNPDTPAESVGVPTDGESAIPEFD